MTKAARPYRVGIAGVGFISEYHAEAIRQVPEAELAAVCDLSRSRAEAFGRARGIDAVYDSATTMLAEQRLDVLHVLVPPDHHAGLAKTALEAGVHVFTEKPMCSEAAACDALLTEARRRELRVGVNHSALFYPVYEQLRRDVAEGKLGHLDEIAITHHMELPQVRFGPFDAWMLRDPRNVMLEIGSHAMSQVLDLAKAPERLTVEATDPVEMPGGRRFYRRWQVLGYSGSLALVLRFSFIPGFVERTICVRGTLGKATADMHRGTYALERGTRYTFDFDHHHSVVSKAKALRSQARRNLRHYVLSKFGLSGECNAFQTSINRSTLAFYESLNGCDDSRVSGSFGREVVEQCLRVGRAADVDQAPSPPALRLNVEPQSAPDALVVGGTGFIGRELVRHLLDAGQQVRVMTRDPASAPLDLRTPGLEVIGGDVRDPADVRKALTGARQVYHLALARAATWNEYREQDVEPTRHLAECCLEQGVERLIYTSSIAPYYTGGRAGTITEETPFDAAIMGANNYARAKAESEGLLLELHRQRGLPVVIARPGIVIGRHGTPYHFGVGNWTGMGVCQFWGRGLTPLPFVLVDDVAGGLIAAAEKPGIEGQDFNLVGDGGLSAAQYVEELERAAGIELQKFPTPIWRYYAGDVVKWIAKLILRYPERCRPRYRVRESLTGRAVFDCSKAKELLGWQPASERDDVIARGIRVHLPETQTDHSAGSTQHAEDTTCAV